MSDRKFYITTAINYVNGPPHLGHAYEAIVADVIARFRRLDGFDTYFLTGTDEHGQKVEKTAVASGKQPQQFCDDISGMFRAMDAAFNISHDDFIRTTEERHKKGAQELWRQLEAKGDIYLGGYKGWYSTRDEAFYAEDETEKRPDGKRYSRESGTEVEWMEEESYFFRLSAYTDKLLDYYEKHPDFIQPAFRKSELVNFVKQGLTDLSISRTSFKWGVPVPGNDRHIMYVWLDALANYMTALGYPDQDSAKYKKFWPCDIHLIGKDIVRFHAVYWPAFLLSAGLPLPKTILSHGHWISGGQKMSKSLGNVVSPEFMLQNYGLDQTRYFLMREMVFGQDGDYTHDLALARINADLANAFGNLCQRSLAQIAKNCEGKVPEHGTFTDDDKALLDKAGEKLLAGVRSDFDQFHFHKALEKIWGVVSDANIYIDTQAPWGLKKTDVARMGTVLYVLAEVIRNLGLIVQPFMPDSAAKILDQVAVTERGFNAMGAKHALKSGTPLPAPAGVFPRILSAEEQKKRGMA